MPIFVIATQEFFYHDQDYGTPMDGPIVDRIRARSRGVARRKFVDRYCDHEFTTPVYIRKARCKPCRSCGRAAYWRRPLPFEGSAKPPLCRKCEVIKIG